MTSSRITTSSNICAAPLEPPARSRGRFKTAAIRSRGRGLVLIRRPLRNSRSATHWFAQAAQEPNSGSSDQLCSQRQAVCCGSGGSPHVSVHHPERARHGRVDAVRIHPVAGLAQTRAAGDLSARTVREARTSGRSLADVGHVTSRNVILPPTNKSESIQFAHSVQCLPPQKTFHLSYGVLIEATGFRHMGKRQNAPPPRSRKL
jgi:hypothetical protein